MTAWDLVFTDGHLLEPGYSGSPVVDELSGVVIGVVSRREGEKWGLAISIEELTKVWQDMPETLRQRLLSSSTLQRRHFDELLCITSELDETKLDLEAVYSASVPADPLATAWWQIPRGDKRLEMMLNKLRDAPDVNEAENPLAFAICGTTRFIKRQNPREVEGLGRRCRIRLECLPKSQ